MKKVCCQLFVFVFFSLSSLGQNSDQYKTAKIEEMANLLSFDLSDSAFGYQSKQWQGYPITVHTDGQGKIDHLGLKLFNRQDSNDKDLLLIFNFVERYLLELLLLKDRQQLANMLISDRVNLEYGDFPDLKKISDSLLLRISQDESGKYSVSWSDHQTGKIVYSLSFPVNYELILGMNKIEIENNLAKEIQLQAYNIEVKGTVRIEDLQLMPKTTNHYIKQGVKYIIGALNSNLYYMKDKGDQFRLIYDNKYPIESLANLMITEEVDHSYQLDISQNKYGYKEASFQVPLKQWVRYCLNSGCVPYFGFEDENETEIRASVVMENRWLAYNHVLYITFSKDLLKQKSGSIKAKLHAYIPTHNVTDLFYQTTNNLDKKPKNIIK